MIGVVICVCCKKDAKTWEIASRYIEKNIDANHYRVYVPDHEVAFFKEISAPSFEVIAESVYTARIAPALKSHLTGDRVNQFGWYLQQFIKLSAVFACEAGEVALIWDADTVPVKPVDFIDDQGRLLYYKGVEHHQPYFDSIKTLLDLPKVVNFSFITQCFPIKAIWAHEFLQLIELRHRCSWIQAMIASIDFNEGNGFSEYETLGTFISHYHAKEVQFIDRAWQRFGNSLIGDIAFLETKHSKNKLQQFDFVSFEKWDKMKPYFIRVQIPYFFLIYLKKICTQLKSNLLG